tara:strand:- start:1427 stop:2056 length:630 start_codon:yes stop_codon:yes gene_type:complete
MVLDTQLGVEATPGAADFSPSPAPANKRAKRRHASPPAGGPPPLIVFMLLGACGAAMILYLSTLGEGQAGSGRPSRFRPYASRNTALAPWLPSMQTGSSTIGAAGPHSAVAAAAATRNASRKRRAPLLNTSLTTMLRSRLGGRAPASSSSARGAVGALPIGVACRPDKPAECHPPSPVAMQATRSANASSGSSTTAHSNASTQRAVYKK